MADALYEERRLAAIYDDLDPDRSDLDAYVHIIDDLGAGSVLDIGCGTGAFCCLLADLGLEVVGLDPALASLDVARSKPGADRVRWVHSDAAALSALDAGPPIAVDMVTMTANVAQVFVSDAEWAAVLQAARKVLIPGGHLVFETRDPRREAWLNWTRDESYARTDLSVVGVVESWSEVLQREQSLVTFRWTFHFEADHQRITSDSTLRFRDRDEITNTLGEHGFQLLEVREAPDRPGRELVFIAQWPQVS